MRFFVERSSFYGFPTAPLGSRRLALLDTDVLNTNWQLEKVLNVEVDQVRSQSMVAIEYQSAPYDGLREGSWYDIPDQVLEEFRYTSVGIDEPGSAFLRARLTGPSEDIAFSTFSRSPDNLDLPVGHQHFGHSTMSNVKLVIRDCGQGNWNEIVSDEVRVVYDLGASTTFSTSRVLNLINQSGLNTETRPVHVFISHWDLDHYHALLCCGPVELSRFRSFFAPSQVPNTQTFKTVQANLLTNGVTIESLGPAQGRAGSEMQLAFTAGRLNVFRGAGRSRNTGGIALTYDGEEVAAILTGDHNYEQILDAVSKNPVRGSAVMVTPHHGGRSGTLDLSGWQALFTSLRTPISVGSNNPYRHPLASVVRNLQVLQGSAPSQTRMVGTLVYDL